VSSALLGEMLMRAGLLDERQVRAALTRYHQEGGHFVSIVNDMNYATESAVARALAVELHMPRFDAAQLRPEPEATSLLDPQTALDRLALPVALRDGGATIWVAMADPTDDDLLKLLQRNSGKRVRPMVCGPQELRGIIRTTYGLHEQRTQEVELDLGEGHTGPISPVAVFSVGEIERLKTLRETLNKSALALRAVARLCVEKGVLDGAEVKKRLKG
jgi:hypothetical protein